MSTIIRTRIVKIGNSQGIRIPQLLLRQLKMDGDVELELQDEQLVIRRAVAPRSGWDDKFRVMAESDDDKLSEANLAAPSRWDNEEWEW